MRIAMTLALLGCGGDPYQGTAVGNPGNLDVSIGDIPDEISLDVAEIHAADLVLLGCDAGAAVVPIQTLLDALGPSSVDISVPGGTWCGALLTLDPEVSGQVVLGGTTAGGTDFTLAMDLGSIPLRDPFYVDGTQLLLVLSLGDIIDIADIEARGAVVDIGADDPSAIDWAGKLGGRADLYEDQDGNGTISDPDTFVAGRHFDMGDTGFGGSFAEDGALASPKAGSSAGGSCQTAGWSWLWLFALPVIFSRRERRERRE
jgi:hypothetical protein